jgi:hypothetical protein
MEDSALIRFLSRCCEGKHGAFLPLADLIREFRAGMDKRSGKLWPRFRIVEVLISAGYRAIRARGHGTWLVDVAWRDHPRDAVNEDKIDENSTAVSDEPDGNAADAADLTAEATAESA